MLTGYSSFMLLDHHDTAKWLTEEQRDFAKWRLLDDTKGHSTDTVSTWQRFCLEVKDYRLWIFVLCNHISNVTHTFQYVFLTITKTTGWGNTKVLLLTAAVWSITSCMSLAMGWSSGRAGD